MNFKTIFFANLLFAGMIIAISAEVENNPLTENATLSITSHNPTDVAGLIDEHKEMKADILRLSERLTKLEAQILQQTENVSLPEFSEIIAKPAGNDSLRFHARCGKNVQVINDGLKATRPHDVYDFAIVLTDRPLRNNELFEVRLDEVGHYWGGNLQIGVMTYTPDDFRFDEISDLEQEKSGTWAKFFDYVKYKGKFLKEVYGTNLDDLQAGDRVGVMRRDDGTLHFFLNGNDEGEAAQNVTENVYGVIDLYGKATKVSIINALD